MRGTRGDKGNLGMYPIAHPLPLVKEIMLVVIALVVLVVVLSAVEHFRRRAVARRHRREAKTRLGAVMLEADKRLEREKATADQAGQLTSVLAAIQKRDIRHVR